MVLSLGMGTGFMRLGGAGGSGDCRMRAEGFITEFCRILVPYECFTGATAAGLGGAWALPRTEGIAVATASIVVVACNSGGH